MPRSSVLRLVEQGRYGAALDLLEGESQIDLSEQVLKAFLEGQVGSYQSASQAASGLLDRHLTRIQRAFCLETIARTADDLEALRLLKAAHELISSSGDSVATARFAVRHARATLNLVGVDAAYIELSRIRRAALTTGDVSAVIDVHLLTAESEAKRNKPSRAAAHLRTAENLLAGTGNVLQLARLEQVRSNLAALSSDLRAALASAHECARFAKDAGWTAGVTGALWNIGLFKLALGDLDGAAKSLREADQQGHISKVLNRATRDTQLQLLCAQKANNCRAFADEVWEADFAGEWRLSYDGLWHHLTRSRLLLSEGAHKDALLVAEAALPHAISSGDLNLESRLRLLAAEALIISGDGLNAAQQVGAVYDACDELPLEAIAELHKVLGLLQSRSDNDAAARFFRRADSILAGAALKTARGSLEDLVGSQNIADEFAKFSEVSEFLHSLSTLLLVGVPEHSTTELLNVILSLNLADGAAIGTTDCSGKVQITATGERPDDSLKPFVTFEAANRSATLWVKPRRDAASIGVLSALRHIARAATELNESRTRKREAAPLWPEETPEEQLGMVVAAANMLEVVNMARRLAPSTIPVLITGESGTGKELLAHALHDASPRKDKPFIPFNCTTVSRDMLDAQLFGYRRGAFTGALEAFPGVIRAAAGGTLFLDEIGELGLDVQPKLLRFLESNEIHPLGEPKPIHVDVRVVAATNANLEQMVSEGRFREDLFYRLDVVRLPVPALRERREEIPLLVQHYLEKFRRETQKTGLRVAEDTMEYLILYGWPGNVRQLANELRRLVALGEPGGILMPEHLSKEIAASRRTIPPSERDLAPNEFVVRLDQPIVAAMEHVERTMIQNALKLTNNRMEEAAQLLGLSRKGLYLKRQRLGIDLQDTSTPPQSGVATDK
jgi:DNA-binding NtrC family response regulator